MNINRSVDTTVLIACRNEEENIERCVRATVASMPEAEILVVDGGQDRTFEIVQTLSAEFPLVRVIRNENDRGKGHAIRTGIAAAQGRVIVQFDADMQFFAEDLPALAKPVLDGQADFCLGSRFLKSSDRTGYSSVPARDFGNRFLAVFVSLLTGRKVTDVTSGVKAWTKEAIDVIGLTDDRYSYEVEIVIKASMHRFRTVEIPVRYASREKGISMHTSQWQVMKAGLVIILKSLGFRLRLIR
jgi:glycosyltransferase involved in cell wall biosynthesis